MLLLEDLAADGARRRKRARREIGSIERRALKRGVRVERVSRLGVLDAYRAGKDQVRGGGPSGRDLPGTIEPAAEET